MIVKLIIFLLNFIHFILLMIPIFLLVLNKKQIKSSVKYLLIICFLVPTHWYFLDNQCILTIISEKLGYDFKDENEAPFIEKYLFWLYKPIMKQIGWNWNEIDITKMSALHWIINFMICWYYCFFY